jgi:Protein of unknown function (DUF1367)
MSEFYAKRHGNTLYPDGDESIAEFASVPFGKPLRVEVKQPRNVQWHRLYFALCHRIANGIGSTSEKVSDTLKVATGHCTTLRTKSYGSIQVPKSISFAAMDQTEFSAFFERCVKVIYEEWGIEPEAVADLLTPTLTHSPEGVA